MANLFVTLAEISVSTSFIIAILLLVSPLLSRRYPAKSLCVVWLVLALRLLVPATFHLIPPVSIPIPDIQGLQEPAATLAIKHANTDNDVILPASPLPSPVDINSPANMNSPVEETVHPGLTAGEILGIVWAAGALTVAAVRLTGSILLARRIRRFAAPVASDAVLAVFREVLADMNVREDRVAVLTYSGAISPMMTGLIHPVILMPDKLVSDPEELALIFRHELVHYKQRHIWYKLILMCVSAIHWFNPLVWGMTHEANAQLERACDQEIVKNADFNLRKKYCRSILSAAALGQQNKEGLKACLNGSKKSMKHRFNNIFDQKAKKRGTPLIAVVLVTVLLVSALVSCRAETNTSEPEDSASPSAGVTASPSIEPALAESSEPSDELLDNMAIARIWADAVQNRDGKGQYELMTKALQETVYDEFAGLNWVTGTSSPWVESYELNNTPSGVTVTFHYATSTGSAGLYTQKLTFAEENGINKISSISELVPVDSDTSPTPAVTAAPTAVPEPSPAPSPTAEPTPAPSMGPTPMPSAMPTASSANQPVPSFSFLVSLLGMTETQVKAALHEEPVAVDEGGLGFDKTGVRVWFDNETHTTVAQVLIMTSAIDINGAHVGDSYESFKAVFGQPVSDQNGDAHFKYGDVYLSVVRDVDTDKTIAVYILAENF